MLCFVKSNKKKDKSYLSTHTHTHTLTLTHRNKQTAIQTRAAQVRYSFKQKVGGLKDAFVEDNACPAHPPYPSDIKIYKIYNERSR